MNKQTYIIAEAGVNHNGSFEMAKGLIDVAKQSGADAVKFQTFKAENLVTVDAKQADYQIENIGEATSQYNMLKKIELSYDEFNGLKQYCDALGIEFLSTPFDFESVDFLIDELEMKKVKIPSGELTNSPLLHYIAKKQKPMIVSTGMATMNEVHDALSFIAHGLAYPHKPVIIDEVEQFYQTKKAKVLLQKYVVILHCTTEYPAPIETINLKTMETMGEELNVPIGFSDHSEGVVVPIAAAARGAVIIEKHFTLSRQLEGPDHLASLEPHELEEMIKSIRIVEQSVGTGSKKPTDKELENRMIARKSIVVKRPIGLGEVITQEHLSIKRPGEGMPPRVYWDVVGQVAKRSYQKDELLDE